MKKPRKSKPKAKRRATMASGRSGGAQTRAHDLHLERRAPVVEPRRRARSSVAFAIPYSTDDREALALIVLPFFLMAFAIGMSQSIRFAPSLESIVAQREIPVPSAAPLPGIATAPSTAKALPAPVAIAPDLTRPSELAARAPDALPATVPAAEAPANAPGVPGALASATASHTLPDAGAAVGDRPTITPTLTAPEIGDARPATTAESRGPVEIAALPLPEGPGAPTAPVTEVPEPATGDSQCHAPAKSSPAHVALLADAGGARDADAFGLALAGSAREQIDDFVVYTDAYRHISYPMGDVPALYGVCTDVIVRAYRALGVDLQALVHQARVGSGDTNIDHRRVETLRRFFAVSGTSLPITDYAEDYRPGDIVSYYRPQNRHSRSHVAIVADVLGPSGRPMIIHNRGWGPQMEDALFVDQITGHYRYQGPGRSPAGDAPALVGEPTSPGGTAKKPTRRTPGLVRAAYTPSKRAASPSASP